MTRALRARTRLAGPCAAVGRALLAIAAVVSPVVPLSAQVPSVDSLRAILPPVTFVFDGLVLQRGAVVDPVLRGTPQTLVVRVTRVGACPVDIGDFTGDTITVWTPSRSDPPVGARARFFAAGWALSSRLAVRSFSTVTLTSDADDALLRVRYDSATRLDLRADLQQRARLSQFIVLGRALEHRGLHPVSAPRDEHVLAYVDLLIRIDSMRPVFTGIPDTLRVAVRRDAVASRLADSTLVGPPLLLFLHPPADVPGFAASYPSARWLLSDPGDLRRGSEFGLLGDAKPVYGAARALRTCTPLEVP